MLPKQVQTAQIQRQVLLAEFQVGLCRTVGPQTQQSGQSSCENCSFAPSLGRHTPPAHQAGCPNPTPSMHKCTGHSAVPPEERNTPAHDDQAPAVQLLNSGTHALHKHQSSCATTTSTHTHPADLHVTENPKEVLQAPYRPAEVLRPTSHTISNMALRTLSVLFAHTQGHLLQQQHSRCAPGLTAQGIYNLQPNPQRKSGRTNTALG
jgi:hypothetical protein